MDEYYKCNACGAIDTIRSNRDAACCLECGTPEDYECIETTDEHTNTNSKTN